MSGRGRGRGRGRGAPRGNSRGRGGSRGGSRGGRGGSAPSRGGRGGRGGRGRGAPQQRIPHEVEETTITTSTPVVEEPVVFQRMTPDELRQTKLKLLNLVSASLIKEPRFNAGDSVTVQIKKLVKLIAFYDPEFVLKLALYSRDDLNIRSASNFVVALACDIKTCQPYIKKYLKKIIRLPSDWLDVASTYQMIPDRYLKSDALPTALRKAMVDKFPEFDVYQLGKYNKERSIKRKAKKAKKTAGGDAANSNPTKPAITIKQMIRQLHIAEPPMNVMCILGKKYPATQSDFESCHLPGKFEPARAGKRMKLPTPETWETLLSEKGNKASTWEELIEHNKLPFMAMLRNLRNLIFSGVNPKYHRWVMNKLKNEKSIASSRQFPTRFFSAYEVIPKDLDDFKQKLTAMNTPVKGKRAKKAITPAYMPAATLFDEYRQSLDTAVKLATTFNINPIHGSTVVFCNSSKDMQIPCNTAKGMGAINKLNEVGALLGLMCKYACEDCDFRIFSSPSAKHKKCHLPVSLIEGSILENMKLVLEQAEQLGGATQFPFDYIEELIRERKKIDNLVVISHTMIAPGRSEMSSTDVAGHTNTISNILQKYRQEVNPNLLFVSVDLSGKGLSILDGGGAEQHPNDVLITGFSDSILRFIAERGNNNQLQYVENIDVAKKLPQIAEKKAGVHLQELDKLDDPAGSASFDEELNSAAHTHVSPWRTAKVFISSTFIDMHGERDVLTRHVFPELRERCKKRMINLVEIDLRWGVTEEESQLNQSVQICLDEVDRCRPLFLGLLGNRYGWCPDHYAVPDEPKYDWVRDYPAGRSITELEIQHGALRDSSARALFYVRDPAFIKTVPPEYLRTFDYESAAAKEKMENLRNMVQNSGHSVYQYKSIWGGLKDNNKPVVKGLDKFRQHVLDDLWGAICAQFPETEPVHQDDILLERSYHLSFIQSRSRRFIGRTELLDSIVKTVNNDKHHTVVVVGKPGAGKSALMATFCREYSKIHPNTFVLPHFIGAAPGSTDIRHTLRRLCNELCERFDIEEEIPEDYKELCQTFFAIVEQASFKGRVLIVIDALDQLSKADRAHNLDWLPSTLPVKVVVSTLESVCLDVLRKRKPNLPEVLVGALSVKERREIVKDTLWEYRKKLDERPMNDQMRVLLKKIDADKPLYLTVACMELRMFGVYEQLTERIKTMAQTVPKLFEEVLMRLELDHSKDLVKAFTCIIVCTRAGVTESELLGLLRRAEKQEVTLPRAVWSRIYSSVELFLRPAGDNGQGTFDFFHKEMSKAVRRRYLDLDQEQELKIHRMLAEYFYKRADPHGDGSWTGTDPRAFSELPHHLLRARMWKVLEKTLCSLPFIEAKCRLGMVFDLVSDFIEACGDNATWKLHERERENVDEFRKFVSANAHILFNKWYLTYQQAANQPDSSAPARTAEVIQAKQPYLKWLNKPQKQDSCLLTIKLAQGITACASSPDGKQIVIASKDCNLRIFDAHTAMEVATLVGHSNWISSCSWSSDGLSIVSSSWDNTAILWDASTGQLQAVLSGHTRLVNSACFSGDVKAVATASWDCTVRTWDPVEGRPLKTFRGHIKPVNSVSYSSDNKRLVSCSWDGLIKIWDALEGQLIATLSANDKEIRKSIRTARFSPNGKQIASSGLDSNIRLWDAFAAKEITALQGHSKPINNIAYSQDGQQLVSASDDRTVKVWDAILGKEVLGTKYPSGWMNAVAYSSDGKYLAGAASECYVSLFDAADLSEISKLTGHTRAVNCVQFSPTAEYLASGSDDTFIKMYSVTSRAEVKTLRGHRDTVNAISFSPTGDRLVSASDDFTVRVWDVQSGTEIGQLSGHQSVVKAVVYAPNGKYVASAGRDNAIFLWNTNNFTIITQFKGHLDWTNVLAFSPDGKKLVSGSWDYNLKVWDARKGKELATLTGHASAISGCAFSTDSKQVISSCYDGTLKVWDAQAGTEITTLIGHDRRVNGFAVAPTGDIASVSDDGEIKIWDSLAGVELSTLVGHANVVTDATFFPEGHTVVSVSEDHTCKVWDAHLQKEMVGHSKPVNACCFSPDARYMVSASDDCTMKVWDTESQQTVRVLKAHRGAVRACAFSPNGDLLASASDDNTVKIWDVARGRVNTTISSHANSVRTVSWSPNGQHIASGSWDNTVRIHQVSTGKIVEVLNGHSDWVTSVAYSPDGKYVVSGSADNTAIVWSGGKPIHTLVGHENWVNAVTFSPDSKTVVSASYDGTMKLWSVATGSEQFTLDTGHEGKSVTSCAFSPNGRAILSTDAAGSLQIWNVKNQLLVAEFVCSSPCLTVSVGKQQIAIADLVGHIYLLQLSGI